MFPDNRRIFTFFKGRVALYALLKSFGIGEGDEVILPGYTCVVVPSAVRFVGAVPVYGDIDPACFNMTPKTAGALVSRRTKAIIVQHTYGLPAEMDGFTNLAQKHGIVVIEDSAHAWGALYDKRPVGTLGDAAFFSSQWSKPFTTGLGGFCCVDPRHDAVQTRLRSIHAGFRLPSFGERAVLEAEYLAYRITYTPRTYWTLMGFYRSLYTAGLIPGSSSPAELDLRKPAGYEKRMSAGVERRLFSLLNNASGLIAHRGEIAAVYSSLLPGPAVSPRLDPVFLRYPVRVRDKQAALAAALKSRIEMGDWFVSPLHPLTKGLERLGYIHGMCPESEKACSQTVNLPTHAGISRDEAFRIARFVIEQGVAA